MSLFAEVLVDFYDLIFRGLQVSIHLIFKRTQLVGVYLEVNFILDAPK